jgi:hypothetical protein
MAPQRRESRTASTVISALVIFFAALPIALPEQAFAGAPAATAPPAASGYVTITDPLEKAFTVEVPAGWRSEAGLARRAALQINAYVRSLSPDKMTYLLIGEPTMPSFTPPSQMGNAIGYREGKLYDSGLGGIALVMRYLPGATFARSYGETALTGLCPGLKFAGMQDRPDLARKAEALLPTPIPSRYDGGEARFTCTHNKQEMDVHIEAATRTTRDGIMWNVLLLYAYITPKAQSEQAMATLAHVLNSVKFSSQWIQMQNNLSQEAAQSINRRMQDIFRQQEGFMQKLNAVDENFQAMDELITGYSTYHDAGTGKNYSLSNANPFKWIDPSSGRIISTQTETKPMWAAGYDEMKHVSPQ